VGSVEFRYDRPERFVAGTVGEPGQRTFYLQVRAGGDVTSVLLEKEQVLALADGLDRLLDRVVTATGGRAPVPALPPAAVSDLGPLELPLTEEFRVSTMSVRWDEQAQTVEVVASSGDVEDDADSDADGDADGDADEQGTPGGPELRSGSPGEAVEPEQRLVVVVDGKQARAFAARARAVVAAGRPPCPICAQPLDPAGHVCPRLDGLRLRR